VGPLWQTFVTSLKVYELSAVEGAQDSFEGRYDSDGTERSLESFVMQVVSTHFFSFFWGVQAGVQSLHLVFSIIKFYPFYASSMLVASSRH